MTYPANYDVFTTKVNIGQAIGNEPHTIPASSPYQVTLLHLANTSSIVITGTIQPTYTEVTTTPGLHQFLVDYSTGEITFNAGDMNDTLAISYTCVGDYASADNVNALQATAVNNIEHTLGLNPQGSKASLVERLGIALNDDGTIKSNWLLNIKKNSSLIVSSAKAINFGTGITVADAGSGVANVSMATDEWPLLSDTGVGVAQGGVPNPNLVFNNLGTGYSQGDVLTVDGGNRDCIITVAVDGSGSITAFYTMTHPGSGYLSNVSYPLTGGTGHNASGWVYAMQYPTISISHDVTGIVREGDKIKYTDNGSVKYAYILAVSFASSTTTITLSNSLDYAFSASPVAITNICYSKVATPQGFPDWFNALPPQWFGLTSATPSSTFNRFRIDGGICRILALISATKSGADNLVGFSIGTPDRRQFFTSFPPVDLGASFSNHTFSVGDGYVGPSPDICLSGFYRETVDSYVIGGKMYLYRNDSWADNDPIVALTCNLTYPI